MIIYSWVISSPEILGRGSRSLGLIFSLGMVISSRIIFIRIVYGRIIFIRIIYSPLISSRVISSLGGRPWKRPWAAGGAPEWSGRGATRAGRGYAESPR